mmetsp:Transcript_71034/g.183166  ORF Transcript_71034/g.183166 Transcript_71034/m.183166 type:complete len:208 (+) Transcript_71034:325-948(+)
MQDAHQHRAVRQPGVQVRPQRGGATARARHRSRTEDDEATGCTSGGGGGAAETAAGPPERHRRSEGDGSVGGLHARVQPITAGADGAGGARGGGTLPPRGPVGAIRAATSGHAHQAEAGGDPSDEPGCPGTCSRGCSPPRHGDVPACPRQRAGPGPCAGCGSHGPVPQPDERRPRPMSTAAAGQTCRQQQRPPCAGWRWSPRPQAAV